MRSEILFSRLAGLRAHCAKRPVTSSVLIAVFLVAVFNGAAFGSGKELAEPVEGKGLGNWRLPTGEWKVVGDVFKKPGDAHRLSWKPGSGILVNGKKGRTGNLFTRIEHGDVEAHIEFMVPKGSNSGVYFQGRYEIQILDSWDSKKDKPKANPKHSDCGGIYERWGEQGGYEGHPPRVNACRKPGEWQSYDVVFRAPRFDGNGKKTENAKFVKVVHNGVVVHENVEVTGPTRAAAFKDEKPLGPLMLQGDHGPVAYRNIRLKVLEGDIEKLADEVLPPDTLEAIEKYEFGKSRKLLASFEENLRSACGQVLKRVESGLLSILKSQNATFAGKQFVFRVLRRIGTEKSVPVLASFLQHKRLAHYARFALQGLSSPQVDEVLRDSLEKVTGDLKVGVISTIGARGDPEAVGKLCELVGEGEEGVVEAALRALGRIGSPEALKALSGLEVPRELERLKADSQLKCADELVSRGKQERAASVYRKFTGRMNGAMVRQAAYRGLFSALKNKQLIEARGVLKAKNAAIHGDGAACEQASGRSCIGGWNDPGTWVSWEAFFTTAGTYRVELFQSMSGSPGSTYKVEVAGQKLEGTVKDTGDWAKFAGIDLGTIEIKKPGTYRVSVKPVKKKGDRVMNLGAVHFERAE